MHDNSTKLAALAGRTIALVGKLVAMNRRAAADLLRQHGATVADRVDASIDTLVVGGDASLSDAAATELLDDELAAAAHTGRLEIWSETRLWERLGLVEPRDQVQQLYTPALLADLLKLPVAIVRRWQRRGLIHPVRQVHRLAYFDYREVATARRLADLLAAGVSPQAIERKLARWRDYLPQVDRPLSQLSIIVEGQDLLLRAGDGLIEAGGQRRFDFQAADALTKSHAAALATPAAELARRLPFGATPAELIAASEECEDSGALVPAIELCRAALAAKGPDAELCFRLAELLYRVGDRAAARERYYMALEIDEDLVEARANLGCVLMEEGQHELAISAFQGALDCHPDYADAHYQLARALDDLGRRDEATVHWQTFVGLAPESPWAELAAARLAHP
jgi:tetratricopeptide (TPR) repeat protein